MSWSKLFSRGEVRIQEVKMFKKEWKSFFYLGDVISCYEGASEAASARIGSVLVGKQDLSLKHRGKIY